MYVRLSDPAFYDSFGYSDFNGTSHFADPRRYDARRLADSDRPIAQLTARQAAMIERLTGLPDYELLLALACGEVSFADIARVEGVHRSTIKRRFESRIAEVRRKMTQQVTHE